MATIDQIQKLREQIGTAKQNVSTVSDDLKLQKLRKSLSAAEGTRAIERWYGNEGETDVVKPDKPARGVMQNLLDATMVPTYLAVGAAKKLVGQSEGESLGKSMIDNVTEDRETFGKVLQNMGVNRVVAAPLGIAMDFALAGAMDPLFGFGAGGARYSSMVGRSVAGAREAGVTGLKAGLKSSLLEKGAGALSTVSKIPGLGTLKKTAEKVGAKAIGATEEFERLAGKNVLDLAEENITRKMGSTTDLQVRKAILDKYGDRVFKVAGREMTGNDIVDFVAGTEWNADWMRTALLKDTFEKMGLIKSGKVIEEAEFDTLLRRDMTDRVLSAKQKTPRGEGKDVLQNLDVPGEKLDKAKDTVQGLQAPDRATRTSFDAQLTDLDEIAPELRSAVAKVRQTVQDGLDVASAPQNVVHAENSAQIIERMIQEADLDAVHKAVYKAVNDLIAKDNKWDAMAQIKNGLDKWEVKDGETLKQILKDSTTALVKMEELGRGLFSTSVVGALSPATLVGSVLSNPTMAMMMGLKSWGNVKYWNRVYEAGKLIGGKSSAEAIEAMLKHPEIGNFLTEHPKIVEQLFGFDPRNLNVGKVANEAIDSLKVSDPKFYKEMLAASGDEEKLKMQLKTMLEQASTGKDKTKNALGTFADSIQRQQAKFAKEFEAKNGRPPKQDEYPKYEDYVKGINMTSQTIDMGAFGEMRNSVSAKAKEEGGLWKVADWYLNKPMEMYGHSDSSFRFGTWRHLIEDGITAEEVEKMSRFVPMQREDFTGFVASAGKKYYKLNATKAAEVVSEMYMNYAAIPGYLKLLRSLPVLGSPFISFSGLMTAKTMKTLLYNPTSIMKLQMVINDFSKASTPAEKEALKSKYYSYLADDPMYVNLGRMPFFKNNPVFMNVRQVNPMVSSIFTPSERTFADTLKGNIGQTIDSSPIAKNPIGQMLMTYLILPLLMEDGQTVQGQFGQPAFPSDATVGEKAQAALRDLPGAYVPTLVQSALGAATSALPEESVQSVLQSSPYTMRRMGEALRGKGALGTGSASSIENSRGEKFTRALISTGLGVSLQPVDLNTVKNLNEKLKK